MHGKQTQDLGQIVVDDPHKGLGWWPVERSALGPDFDQAIIPVLHLHRRAGEYANDVNHA